MSNLRGWGLAALLALTLSGADAQKIRNYYVSAPEEDGTIYHLLAQTLFASDESGDLTFDITYKVRKEGLATINFTYKMLHMTPADSIRFSVGDRTIMSGSVQQIFTEPGRKEWTHRYTFTTPVTPLHTFFDAAVLPEVTVYAGGRAYVYPAKKSAWRSYAPVGFRIFEMIRANEVR